MRVTFLTLLRRAPARVVFLLAFGLVIAACGTAEQRADTVVPTATFVPSPPTSTPVAPQVEATVAPTPIPPPTPIVQRPTAVVVSPTPTPSVEPPEVTPSVVTGSADGVRSSADAGAAATPPPIPTAVLTPQAQPTPQVQPSATPRPIPTATPRPQPTPVPQPTATPRPQPTAVPQPTVAPRPQPTAVPPQPQVIEVGCVVQPQGTIRPGEIVTFRAIQRPLDAPVRYSFVHGDGSVDSGADSRVAYAGPGTYGAELRWTLNGAQGSVSCGPVTVVANVAPPTAVPVAPSFNLAAFIGRTEADAVVIARNQGFELMRILRRDGTRFPVTNSFRSDRLNVEVDNGVVSAAAIG